MVAKCFIFAMLCIALTQVQGDNLGDAINRALKNLQSTNTAAEMAAQESKKESTETINALKDKGKALLQEETRRRKELVNSLEGIATAAERNATQNNRPPATTECIKMAKTQAVQKLQALGSKFATEMKKLEKAKMGTIETTCQPLAKIQFTLKEKYDKYQTQIKRCMDVPSVYQVMDKMGKEYKTLISDLKKIPREVNITYNEFKMASERFLFLFSRQENDVWTEGSEAIRNC